MSTTTTAITAITISTTPTTSEPSTFISAVLLVAASMLRLGLPHVSVLSKIDLLKHYGSLPFSLDFYTEMTDLGRLVRYLGMSASSSKSLSSNKDVEGDYDNDDNDDNREDEVGGDGDGDGGCVEVKCVPAVSVSVSVSFLQGRYKALSLGICDVVEDLGLVSFLPLNIEDSETVGRVLAAVDKANGYSFASVEIQEYLRTRPPDSATATFSSSSPSPSHLFRMASEDLEPTYCRSLEIQERYE
eukprot:gene1623-3143_t